MGKKNHSLLIIEDSKGVALLLKQWFEEIGIIVRVAEAPHDVMKDIAFYLPDIIVADTLLGGVSVKDLLKNAPLMSNQIIWMSGNSTLKDLSLSFIKPLYRPERRESWEGLFKIVHERLQEFNAI